MAKKKSSETLQKLLWWIFFLPQMASILDSILSFDSAKEKEENDLYQILGCDSTSSLEQIQTEFKIRALKYHPDKNPGNPEAAKMFERLQFAKEVLTDPVRRDDYDKWKGSGVAIPYRDWSSLQGRMHTGLHWAAPKKERTLEAGPGSAHREKVEKECEDEEEVRDRELREAVDLHFQESSPKSAGGWSPGNRISSAFRKYQI
ncbi:unnamed protein product [Cyprideis torosa]|uniref:Uncharacterized protein n=1 Tax=Cyprideis torosa TaxID=163714 RepID=A0A7R8WBL6_9CRUS|nr:unnamed protein product [Cyprideis torosa]CAG0886454.1 unnamed protein product [Cyprideis torosa]